MDFNFLKINSCFADCALGYQGPKCTMPCRYPNYGRGCQQKCDCGSKNCNPLSGCFESPGETERVNRQIILLKLHKSLNILYDMLRSFFKT